MSTATKTGRPDFELPPGQEASEPPEARGLARDGVRLLVADRTGVRHSRFAELGRFLSPGDLLVVNTSATLAAAVDGYRPDGRAVTVHFSTRLDDGSWLAELRPPGRATGPVTDGRAGERIALPAGAAVELRAPAGPRLWRVRAVLEGGAAAYLAAHGRPITYAYLRGSWPLRDYQTVFARDPGSAEMPSAGRPFSAELVTSLAAAGVVVAPITLHTGVSSLEAGEPPLREWFRVPQPTAELVTLTRAAGRRVIAVGTTVTRALESAADLTPGGLAGPGADRAGAGALGLAAAQGWTDLVLGPQRPARVVDGIITGWHAPGASHLDLLTAVAGTDLVSAAYREAVRHGYQWHEFGDSCMLLP
jgi:S-adenosylmethionine:tRNA ribosyltransferase-isomerase